MIKRMKKLTTIALTAGALMSAPVQAVEFGAFGNINLTQSDGSPTSFALGGFDLFARQDISDKSTALVEYVIESGDGTSFLVDLERLVVDYEFNPKLIVSAGRIHSPVGYWNTAYHHGQLLQPTVSRPEFIEFEDGAGALFPVHMIGLFAEGELSSSVGLLKYKAAWANNPQVDTSIATVTDRAILLTMSGDKHSGKTTAIKLAFEPEKMPVQVGTYYQDATYNNISGTPLMIQTVAGIDIHANVSDFEFLTEYYLITNDDLKGTARANDVNAYFAQLAYTYNETWTPVYRYESSRASINDPFANGTVFTRVNYSKSVIALRHDLDESNVLTLEYANKSPSGAASISAWNLQWAFMMF